MSQLSDYMSRAKDQPLPDAVIEQAKLHILDTVGAMISGATLPPGKVALAFAKNHPGERDATIAGSGLLCSPAEAALVNGMLAHSDETDDSHAPSHSHPGCAVIPAALATGEYYKINGAQFLRSVVLGYDIGTRVLMTLGGAEFQSETHHDAHGMANTFGASAASGCAAGLDARQMRWLLDLASQQDAGIAAWQRDSEHIEKSLVFGGMPARNGVMAAELIRLGATGVSDVFSGADNFLLAFAPEANPGKLVEQLGQRYEVTRTNIKKWTVGSPIQAPLDALELIMSQHSLKRESVERVVVRIASSSAKTVNNRQLPDISLQQMLAVMLVDGTVSFGAAHDLARMNDPVVTEERSKIQLIGDDELEKLLPKLIAVVEVSTKDGSTYSQRVDAVRGTVANPMPRAEVVTKFQDLTESILGKTHCDKLVEFILNVERATTLGSIRPVLRESA
ncbi:MmgE/PrpD family protein [Silvibacterium acidisoli]|uniref:MmgE/PrpD family protein n=1 Tax=Acidobacteriaceae bacterium ZG23-2 TaxID=2883246 RepID=UPI00406C7FDA